MIPNDAHASELLVVASMGSTTFRKAGQKEYIRHGRVVTLWIETASAFVYINILNTARKVTIAKLACL